MPTFLLRCCWTRRNLGQLCKHLFQALSGLSCIAAFGEQGCTLLLQAATQLELSLCFRFPFQPKHMLPLSFFLFLLLLAQ